MILVVADTGPIHYLHVIGRLEVLPALYGEVLVPPAVLREMAHPNAPPSLRRFAESPPDWLRVRTPGTVPFLDILDDGEAEAISLAVELKAQRILILETAVEEDFKTRKGPSHQGGWAHGQEPKGSPCE